MQMKFSILPAGVAGGRRVCRRVEDAIIAGRLPAR
jgi:hypothetical protein